MIVCGMREGSANFANLATKLVAMATFLQRSPNECTMQTLQYVYKSWKFGENQSSSFWDYGEIDSGSRTLRFSMPNFCGWEEKFSKVGFKAWPNTKRFCKFRGNPLRDGWGPLSINLGPKPTNQISGFLDCSLRSVSQWCLTNIIVICLWCLPPRMTNSVASPAKSPLCISVCD